MPNNDRYKKHMQHVHCGATAVSIESAAKLLIEDVIEYLVKHGVKPNSKMVKEIKNLSIYEYETRKHE